MMEGQSCSHLQPQDEAATEAKSSSSLSSSVPNAAEQSSAVQPLDVVIIGGGVVGLSILRHATLQGYRAVLVERNEHLVQEASGHNTGIVCTGVDAPIESLERALIRESIAHIRTYCREMNVPTRDFGSLICAWPKGMAEQPSPTHHVEDTSDRPHDEGDNPLDRIWRESCDAGDADARIIRKTELLQLEPNLNPACLGAVHIPGEIVIDPWLYSISLASHAQENGATIYNHFDVDLQRTTWDETAGTWTLYAKDLPSSQRQQPSTTTMPPNVVRARAVVNAAGLWSDIVEEQLLQTKPSYEARPRRGQYVVLEAGVPQRLGRYKVVLRHPIQPIPTQRTKGIFVFSTVYDQLVVGPTALDQEARTDDDPCPIVRDQLTQYATRVVALPKPYMFRPLTEYVGIRPGTQHRDYQIQLQAKQNWVTCSGIRSTGLTASLGIGRHVVYLLQQGVLSTPKPLSERRTTPLPSLSDLVRDFDTRRDGCVTINGQLYYVTHPLTSIGWKSAYVS